MRDGHRAATRYTYMGMGCSQAHTVMADGVNEHGLCGATQYIQDGAVYQKADGEEGQEAVAAVELLSYLLSSCRNVAEVTERLRQIRVVGQVDPVFDSVSPLHHMFVDRDGNCIVVEYTDRGPDIMENPVGVMTNNPEFRWHLTNLKMQSGTVPYSLYETKDPKKMTIRSRSLTAQPIPQPGDFSSPSRFIRGASLTSMIDGKFSGLEAVITGIRVLEAMSVPRGTYFLGGREQYTRYLALLSPDEPGYYFKTYHDGDLKRICLENIKCASVRELYRITQTVRIQEMLFRER